MDDLVRELERLRRPDGRIGPAVNSTVWGILALRGANRPPGASSVAYVLSKQRANGGWSWIAGAAPDSNDTAAAIQALRAAGVPRTAKAIRRGLAYLRRLQNPDGGFELAPGRGSDHAFDCVGDPRRSSRPDRAQASRPSVTLPGSSVPTGAFATARRTFRARSGRHHRCLRRSSGSRSRSERPAPRQLLVRPAESPMHCTARILGQWPRERPPS